MRSNITIYDAAGSDRVSIKAWKAMFKELADFHEIIYRLVFSQISGQFKQSFIGYVWIALPPIATTIIFTLLRKAQVVNVPMTTDMPYALFALIGTTMWGLFAQITNSSTGSIVSGGMLVSKVYFPREVLVLSSVANCLVLMVVRLAVVALTFVLLGFAPHWQVVYFPLVILPMVVLALGLGLLLAPLHTVMPDIGRLVGFGFQFGMFLAPTIYPTPSLATASTVWEQGLYWLHSLNPVTHYIHSLHSLIETGTFGMDAGLLCSYIISFTVLFVGWRFFHICEPMLAERM